MEKEISCFVIIGYHTKTSYANGKLRVLDLDQTFDLLIKPVFDGLKIPCYRACDKNLSESIDRVMLHEIRNADIALADISTLNANVMWELGVRHALKPRHTIMICEKEQMKEIPFDINHFIVHEYTHSEAGIPYVEVDRFRKYLTGKVKEILEQEEEKIDSPVYTFLKDEFKIISSKEQHPEIPPERTQGDSFATLMAKAESAKKEKRYENALEFFAIAYKYAYENMTLKSNLPFIISRQALCTYKLKKPTETDALIEAQKILKEVNPDESQDIEVLGLSGAINKRLFEISAEMSALDKAIQFYEKGFTLKQDYYNGINSAFMLYKKAALLKARGEEWEDILVEADYIRNRVLDISRKLEAESDFREKEDAVWILLTIAEAFNYKGNNEKMAEYEEKAFDLAKEKKDDFAISCYNEQKEKIAELKKKLI